MLNSETAKVTHITLVKTKTSPLSDNKLPTPLHACIYKFKFVMPETLVKPFIDKKVRKTYHFFNGYTLKLQAVQCLSFKIAYGLQSFLPYPHSTLPAPGILLDMIIAVENAVNLRYITWRFLVFPNTGSRNHGQFLACVLIYSALKHRICEIM